MECTTTVSWVAFCHSPLLQNPGRLIDPSNPVSPHKTQATDNDIHNLGSSLLSHCRTARPARQRNVRQKVCAHNPSLPNCSLSIADKIVRKNNLALGHQCPGKACISTPKIGNDGPLLQRSQKFLNMWQRWRGPRGRLGAVRCVILASASPHCKLTSAKILGSFFIIATASVEGVE